MKTIFVNASPKKRFSATSYLLKLTGFLCTGEKMLLPLRTPKGGQAILNALRDGDNLVIGAPLYVDSLPSHVIPFLETLEEHCHAHQLNIKIYGLANNGFIEGKQNAPMFDLLENFCDRANLQFAGGIGIGGGVMLNVTRIVFGIQLLISLIALLSSVLPAGTGLDPALGENILVNVGLFLFFNAGVFYCLIQLARSINRGRVLGRHYTRIMLPSFLFILAADIFFFIISLFQGGLFRGWLAKKEIMIDMDM